MSEESQAISHNISLLLTAGKTAEARAELERLLALDVDDPDARSLAGDVYAYTGAESAAYKQYNLAAETYNRLGRADMALAVHHKILELDPSMMDAATQTRVRLLNLLVGAEDAIVSGQNEKAVAGYREAIRQFPNHTITYQRLASLLVRLNRVEEAAEQYLVVARAFYDHGVLAKARPYFERVLELHPSQGEALKSVLACLKAEGKEEEGERFLKAAVQAHLQAGRMEEAAAIFEGLPEGARDGATPLGAGLLLQSGEVGQAERMAGQLDLARPELQEFFKRLGRAALERGDSTAADAYFRWVQGQAQKDAPVVLAPVLAPQAVEEPPMQAVELQAAPVVEPAPIAVPAPAAPVLAVPPPGLGAPPPPPPSYQAPEPEDQNILQTMGEMCLAEEMFEEAKQVFERLTKADPARKQYWELLNSARAGLGLSPVFGPSRPPQAPPIAATPPAPAPPPAPPAPAQVVPPAPPQPAAAPAAVLAPAPAPLAPPLPAAPVPAPPPESPRPAPAYFSGIPEIEPLAQRTRVPEMRPMPEGQRPEVEWSDAPSEPPAPAAAAPEAEPVPPAALPPPPPPLVLSTAAAQLVPPEAAPVPVVASIPAPAPIAEPEPEPVMAASPPPPPPPPPATPAPAPAPVPAPPVFAPPPMLAPPRIPLMAGVPVATRGAVAMGTPGGARIERTQFTIQLGELPPAMHSEVDDNEEIIE